MTTQDATLHQLEPKNQDGARTARSNRAIGYVAMFVVLLAGYLLVDNSRWLGSTEIHTLIETVACVVATFTGVLALVRFYSKKSNTFLFIAVGFLGTALLDGYHAVVTSSYYAERFPSALSSLIPWSWIASRIYLSVCLAGSWLAWRRENRLGKRGQVREVTIYLSGIALTMVCFFVFAFIPLPPAYYRDLWFPRPEEWVPALFFLVALIGFLKKDRWRSNQFESWLVLSLIVNVTLQSVYMSRSTALFDGMFDAAHLLKVVSYVLVCVGLLASVYTAYSQVDSTKTDLEVANDEMARRVEEADVSRMRAESAESTLSQVASRLAMPPKTFQEDKRYSLNSFSLSDMMDCGAAIRNLSSRHSTESAFAGGLVQLIYEKFRDPQGESEFAMVRAFRIERYKELEPALQEYVRSIMPTIQPNTSCLVLAGTVGDQPSWCEVSASTDHQAIPLPSADAVRRLPMIAQLLRQLGIIVGGDTDSHTRIIKERNGTGVFHVPCAVGSPTIPAQEQFVVPYGIQSVVGFGDELPDGKMFALIGFAKTDISKETANLMSHLSFSAKIGLMMYDIGANTTIAQIQTLDELLSNHEQIVADQDAVLRKAIVEATNSNAELKQFAYVASHDLQEPLRKVNSFCQMLEDEYSDQLDDNAKLYIRYAVDGANRMKALVADLLSYSRIESQGKPLLNTSAGKACSVAIENLLGAIEENDAQITVGPLPEILADQAQLVRLFQNIISNAIKYRGAERPEIEIGAEEHELEWVISVRDNGIGMEPQYYERIFVMFQRLHARDEYAGTGIGLAICKRIVDRLGGRLWVESDPGSGSQFFLSVPKLNDAPTEGLTEHEHSSPNYAEAH